ncbi:hypothetical protein Scep_018409 [Stephania cephalantha]|uniref:CMP/dCMP-type deaminase domain-containing protein n=1 Tax=Stephania cephalantha TaxID=152367 RepID=A0AAP0NM47_9MAGN
MMSATETTEGWEILHIPPADLPCFPPSQFPTVDVVASQLDPKLANTLIRRLNQIAPLDNLRHLKRVRKNFGRGGNTQLSIILCLAHLETLPHNVLHLVNAYHLTPFLTKVAKYAASSKEEWQEQCQLWPTSYHPPTYNIDGITGFSEEDSQSVFGFMNMAIKLAKSTPQVVNAAIIVDPSVRQVIASACDQTCSSHAPTENNNLETDCKESGIASSKCQVVETRETLASNRDYEQTESLSGVSCLYPWTWSERHRHNGNSYSWHPLRHAALVAIEYAAARDRRLFPGSEHAHGQSIEGGHVPPSPKSSPAKKPKLHTSREEEGPSLKTCSNGFNSDAVRPYLCTGFDIFLVWEPCIMCSMALVHQRIRRVFYAFPNLKCGGLGSVHRLQGEKSLNHHYAVFRVMLPEETLKRGRN